MMRIACPICSKVLTIEKIDELPSFPFCSDRCRLVDLGRWIDGAYAIPGSASTLRDVQGSAQQSSAQPEPIDPDDEGD